MNKTFDYDVFLSHSPQDEQTARALAERLKADGLRAWLAAWETAPGDVQQALERSRALALCMSPAYFDREWEALEGHTLLFRDSTDAQRHFIPLLVADCDPPDVIAQFAVIDWRVPSDEAYEAILDACRGEGVETAEPEAREEQADQARMVLKGHTGWVWGVPVTPDGKAVVSGS